MNRLNRRDFVYGCGAAAVSGLVGCDRSIGPIVAVDEFIADEMRQRHIPGLAVSVIKGGALQWSKGYGWADTERRMAIIPDSQPWPSGRGHYVRAVAVALLFDRRWLQLRTRIPMRRIECLARKLD